MRRLLLPLCLLLAACGEKQRGLTHRGEELLSPPATPPPLEAAPAPPLSPEPAAEPPRAGRHPLTEALHAIAASRAGSTPHARYTETFPVAGSPTFNLLPIPGGEFFIHRLSATDSSVPVEIPPFWMAECEVTWDLFRPFMELGDVRNADGSPDRDGNPLTLEAPELRPGESLADIVSCPPPPPHPLHLEMGESYAADWPTISMTRHAASKFCEWLTAMTRHYYRLPTEAEWEYACRAGTTTAWSSGDDPAALIAHAWFRENSNFSYHPIGRKKPNPWGLHDLHGNVAEWCLDAHHPDPAIHWADGISNPWHPPSSAHPGVVRGGSYHHLAAEFRSSARIPSSPAWQVSDPRRPKSLWYLTNNSWVGFLIVRPLALPDVETMHRI